MNYLKKMLVLVVAFSTMLFAEGYKNYQITIVDKYQGFYTGIAYGFGTFQIEKTLYGVSFSRDKSNDSVSFIGGYNFNHYAAIEGRYNLSVNSDIRNPDGSNNTVDSYSIFLKPQLPLNRKIYAYGLLGYSSTDTTFELDGKIEGITWGLGGKYLVTGSVELFADFTKTFENTTSTKYTEINAKSGTITLGINYKF